MDYFISNCIKSILRHAFTSLGTWLLTKGIVFDESMVETCIGIVFVVGASVCSVAKNWRNSNEGKERESEREGKRGKTDEEENEG